MKDKKIYIRPRSKQCLLPKYSFMAGVLSNTGDGRTTGLIDDTEEYEEEFCARGRGFFDE